ncbi:MAG: UvrD-helicase domain-containing protein, partial [Phycisphaerae bacterium]
MNLTKSQQAAVEQRGGNLLVAASAGSGKTEVLARRCVSLIADPQCPCRVDQLLVVTFTRAAAAELRARLGQMLRQQAAETRHPRLRDHLRRQEVLLDTADIGTIDAWCARIVREHFAATETGVDPAFTILGEQQAVLLRAEAVAELFEWVYTANDRLAGAARDWILRNARPSDDFLRGLALELNSYREHLVNPEQWFARQLELHSRDGREVHADAERVLAAALAAECQFQQDQLDEVIAAVASAAQREQFRTYRETLASWRGRVGDGAQVGPVVAELATFRFPRKPSGLGDRDAALREEIKVRWFEARLKKRWNSDRVEDVLAHAGSTAELIVTLLRLAERYRTILDAMKRERATYEFGDVLRMALDLLGTPAAGQHREPTPVARLLQRRYEHILVDEYQDTSPVQVELLRLVTRSEPGRSNRFMVGDVKQSIYGFREAEPRLFTDLIDAFSHGCEEGQVLPLCDNFRSHSDLVGGLNRLFASLFDPALGGTRYADEERLRARRDEIANPTLDAAPRIELQLVFENTEGGEEADETSEREEGVPLERIEREARIAAARIHVLLAENVQIPERDSAGTVRLRPLRLADIVILLRSAKGNAPLLAAALRQAGIPGVASGRESILDSMEVQDVRCALALLANRQQDVPLAAYLRGPMVGLSAAQLLEIRRAASGPGFYEAVEAYRVSGGDPALVAKLAAAMEQLDHWAGAARRQELPVLLRQILRDTGLVHFAQALPGGEHRVAMLRALEALAAEFATRGRHAVAEFVQYLDALAEGDVPPAVTAVTGEDVVRIMTIHAAKGLEFPVVFLLGTGAAFSRRPRRGNLVCDEQRGVGIEFFDYPARAELVNAAFLISRHAVDQRELEEELRLLYVSATRARERLVIVGHTPEKTWSDLHGRYAGSDGPPPLISRLSARSMLEWVMMGVAASHLDVPCNNARPLVRVKTHVSDALAPVEKAVRDTAPPDAPELTGADRLWIERGRAWVEAAPDTSVAQLP